MDETRGASIILNEHNLESDILSTKASELTVSYEKQVGNESKAFTVASQLLTIWNPQAGKFTTTVYDKFL